MIEMNRHRTAAITGTVTPVPNYPTKLKVYLNNASPYWQAVYWDNGKTYRRSTKTTNKLESFKKAKEFYEHILLSKYQNTAHLKRYNITLSTSKNDRADYSFETIAAQWIARKSTKWTLRYTRIIKSRIRTYLFRDFASKDIAKITPQLLLQALQKMEARGVIDSAHRLLNNCKHIWQYAIVTGACNKDITIGLSEALHTPIAVPQKAVAVLALPKLMRAITDSARQSEKMHYIGLELIAHTFARTSELLKATWEEFDMDKALWRIPAARMKMRTEHIVPLSSHVIALLDIIKADYPSTKFVIHRETDTPLAPDALIKELHNMGYKGKMTTHGFRAIASTILNEHGFRADAIERQLAHSERNSVRRAYNRAEYMVERVEMMDWWSNYLIDSCKMDTAM
jgi:integrase